MSNSPPPDPSTVKKSEGAFRTIGEVSATLGVPQHVLRYWETRFPQVKPLQRTGNRRYYRPADVALLQKIQTLLDHEGYSIRGVQKLLLEQPVADAGESIPVGIDNAVGENGIRDELIHIRHLLAAALSEDMPSAAEHRSSLPSK